MNAWKSVIAGSDLAAHTASKPGKAGKQRPTAVKAAATAVVSPVQLPAIVAPPRSALAASLCA